MTLPLSQRRRRQKQIKLIKKELAGALVFSLAGAEGIEPSIMVLETIAIPFNYAPK